MADILTLSFRTFGELLKHLRERARLTQDELGVAVGYSRAHIARLESSQRNPDPAAVKARFIEALDLGTESQLAQQLLALAGEPHGAVEPSQHTPHNLSLQLTSFIGRQDELTEVQDLLRKTRLLTLTGAGGSGKTRLAIEVAAHLAGAGDYPDGVWLARLETLTDGQQVIGAVAAAVSMPVTTDVPLSGLIAYLRPKHMLLILDNSEHLIEACARLAQALLSECPHLRVLATSRESLDIPGELAWRVPSLQEAEALQLFAARAQSARPGFMFTSEDRWIAEEICRRLDGIPLALEFAAARLRVLSLEQIAQRLDDRFTLLTDGMRTALPRHQTLRATIDWSYDLLSESEQALLRKLAAFSGGWTLEAAEAICGSDVLDGLQQLVDKSLITTYETHEGMHYRMLETIRQYGAQKLLANGEEPSARRAHALYYTDSLKTLLAENAKQQDKVWLDRIEAILDNLRTAAQWVVRSADNSIAFDVLDSMADYWFVNGDCREGLAVYGSWLERSDLTLEQRIKAWVWVYYLHWRIGEIEKGDQAGEQAFALARESGNTELTDWVMLKTERAMIGDLRNGTNQLDAVIERCRAKDDPCALAAQLSSKATVSFLRRDYAQAEKALQECIQLLRQQKKRAVLSYQLAEYSYLKCAQGEYARAREVANENLELALKIGNRVGIADAQIAMAQVALLQRDTRVCCQALREALTIYRWVGNVDRMVQAVTFAAGLSEQAGAATRAVQLMAAVDDAYKTLSPVMPYPSHWIVQTELSSLRSKVPADLYERAWAEGRQTTLDQVVESVLDELQ